MTAAQTKTPKGAWLTEGKLMNSGLAILIAVLVFGLVQVACPALLKSRNMKIAQDALWEISNYQWTLHRPCDGYASSLRMLEKFSLRQNEKFSGTAKYSFEMTTEQPIFDSELCKQLTHSYFVSATPRAGTNGLKHYGLNPSGLYESTEPIKVTLTGHPPAPAKRATYPE